MAEFKYTAINDSGKTLNGTIAAEDIENAIALLKQQQLFIVDVKEKSILEKEIKLSYFEKINDRDLAFFCRQMSTMLSAGINILKSLELVKGQTTNKKFAEVIGGVYSLVEKGNPVCFSMREYPDVFPIVLTNMIEAGEISGSLDESFNKMAIYYEKEEKLKNKIKNALVYPVFVLILSIVVLNILMIFVLPTFSGLFTEMDVELPGITKFVIGFGKFMADYWFIILGIIFIGIWVFNVYKKTPKGSIAVGKRRISRPIFGKIILNSETSSFARTLSTLINSGVPIVPALYTIQKLFTNAYISQEFTKVIDQVKSGESLSEPLDSMNVFPKLVPAMIKTGEDSGNIETMLDQIADYYEQEVDNSVTRLTAIFEPVMIVFIAVIVGLLLASIILPMFKLYGNIE